MKIFISGMINKNRIDGRDIKEDFTFVSGVRIWRRHIELEHGESPLLSLTLQHRSRVGVVVQYSASHLADFTGVLYQDTASHLHLNLTLIQASGTITGVISGSGAHATQSVLLRLPLQPGNSSHQVKLSATECRAGQVEVSLKPLSEHNRTITKSLPCVSHNMRTFRSTPSQKLNLDSGTLVGDCGLGCLSSWLYWLDPAHWMDNFWPQSRIIIFTIVCVIFIIIIIIISKTCCCVAKLCSLSNPDKSTLKIKLENNQLYW